MSTSFTFNALGTTWWIEVFDTIKETDRAVIADDCAVFASTFESKYSRFKSDSLVSILNRERVVHDTDDETCALLRYAKRLALATAGHFNVLVGETLLKRGYDSNYSFVDSGSESEVGDPITDLVIDGTTVTLSLGQLDIGGFGKGYLIDLLATRLKEVHNCQYFLINGGGDIYVSNNNDEPINIHLEHPVIPYTTIGTINLKDEGFASSSPFKRRWMTSQGEASHIIGEHDEIATYVRAATAGEADAFATAALIMTEAECVTLAKSNNLRLARFTPSTNQLWQTSGFSN